MFLLSARYETTYYYKLIRENPICQFVTKLDLFYVYFTYFAYLPPILHILQLIHLFCIFYAYYS